MSKEEPKQNLSQNELDVLKKLSEPEVQASLNNLIDHLPKINEMLSSLTSAYDFANSLAKDETLKNDMISTVTEMGEPILDSSKKVVRNVLEAKERAEKSTETFSVFSLAKMLKDPQIQGSLRFFNEFLKVSAEEKAKKDADKNPKK